MKEFIDKNNLLYSSQYGFRKSHSTEHAVLDIVEDIPKKSNMDLHYFSCGVFIELKRNLIRSIMTYYPSINWTFAVSGDWWMAGFNNI